MKKSTDTYDPSNISDVIESEKLNDRPELVGVQTHWEGPLPPPTVLQGFSEVVENGAERLFTAWEQETAHRRRLENRQHDLEIWNVVSGKLAALIFALGVLFLAYVAIINEAPWVAAIIGSLGIGSVVGSFLYRIDKTRTDQSSD